MAEVKLFKSFEEQLSLLKDRNLACPDDKTVLNTLKYMNYYRFSGYTLAFRENDSFRDGVCFNEIMQAYMFDQELRSIIFYLLNNVEIAFRTHIAYHHAEEHGPTGYTDSATFESPVHHSKFIEGFNQTISRPRKIADVFVQHHFERYQGIFPIWVVVELLSFGDISKLYRNLHSPIAKTISTLYYNIPNPLYLYSWLHGLSLIRNICAHHGRLYYRKIDIKPRLAKEDRKLNLAPDRIFVYIFILKKLIPDEAAWRNFLLMLKKVVERYPKVNLEHLGFPDDWLGILQGE